MELLRTASQQILNSASKYLIPKIGNLLGKGIDIGEKLRIPTSAYADRVSSMFDSLHGLARDTNSQYYPQRFPRELIRPVMNANFGVGTLGVKELIPTFVGDRQALAENKDIVLRNPEPEPSIFRNTGKRMPIELMLPEKRSERKKRMVKDKKIPMYLREEEQFGQMIYGPKKKPKKGTISKIKTVL